MKETDADKETGSRMFQRLPAGYADALKALKEAGVQDAHIAHKIIQRYTGRICAGT